MSEINRYNQGFGKFGPMEQCKDGKWVRVEDYDGLLATYLHRKKYISKLENDARVVQHQVNSLKDTLEAELKDNNRLDKSLIRKNNTIFDLTLLTVVLAAANIVQFVARMLG